MQLTEFLKTTTQKKFAASLNITQALVSRWNQGGQVSAELVLPVSEKTNWQVTPHDLRPDLYPHPHDGMPLEMRVA